MADTKTSALTALTGASLAAADLVAVVDVSDTTLAATGTDKRMTVTELVVGLSANGLATDAELAAHEADTTSVHGIADTSVLATATTLATAVSNHAAATDPHADRAYADTNKLSKASNLSDLANAATARTNLGLAAIAASGSASDLSAGTVPSARLGTGGAGLGAKVLADNQTFIALPAGDVAGPASATDNAIARFDLTTGKLLQSTPVTVSDVAGEVVSIAPFGADSNISIALVPKGTGRLYLAGVADSNPSLLPFSDDGTGSFKLYAGTTNFGGRFLADAFRGITEKFRISDAESGITFVSGGIFGWGASSSTAPPIGFPDTQLSRPSAGVVSIDDGTKGSAAGSILARVIVEANAAVSGAPNILSGNESNSVLTNEGATAENYHTLPTAVAGLVFTFIVQDTDGLRIVAAAGDTIRPGAVAASSTAGFIRCATQGAFITLTAINATEWMATAIHGTWTVDA